MRFELPGIVWFIVILCIVTSFLFFAGYFIYMSIKHRPLNLKSVLLSQRDLLSLIEKQKAEIRTYQGLLKELLKALDSKQSSGSGNQKLTFLPEKVQKLINQEDSEYKLGNIKAAELYGQKARELMKGTKT